jgi:hypothetical protein
MKRFRPALVAVVWSIGSAVAQIMPSATIGPAANGQPPIAAINVQAAPYNATGNMLTFTDGAIVAGGNILSSASHSCVGLMWANRSFCTGRAHRAFRSKELCRPAAAQPLFFPLAQRSRRRGMASGAPLSPYRRAARVLTRLMTRSPAPGAQAWSRTASSPSPRPRCNRRASPPGGSACLNGASQAVSGTTGAGARFSALVTVAGNAITAVNAISVAGAYTVNPTSLTAEPVTGDSCVGATLNVKMGVLSLGGAAPGDATTWPSPNNPTTSGGGTGATIKLVSYQVGGNYTFGTDDTAALTAAATAATAAGAQLYLPRGGYWLASQTACIALHNVTLAGDGWPQDSGTGAALFPGGTIIAVSNTTTSAFCDMSSVTIRDLAIYYPLQDGSQPTPIAYPPTFESALYVNDSFLHDRFMNSYQLLKVDASVGGGVGRLFLDSNLIYCIDKCLFLQNGAADTIQLGATNYFGPGAYGSTAIAGPAYLQRYTQSLGEITRIDLGAATYKNTDDF